MQNTIYEILIGLVYQ